MSSKTFEERLVNISHYFPFKLKDKQVEGLQSVYSGKDTLVILPTGYGKSLIYQALPIILNGVVLVVSPLTSIMLDQVSSLNGRGLLACMLTNDGKPDENHTPKGIKFVYRPVFTQTPTSSHAPSSNFPVTTLSHYFILYICLKAY